MLSSVQMLLTEEHFDTLDQGLVSRRLVAIKAALSLVRLPQRHDDVHSGLWVAWLVFAVVVFNELANLCAGRDAFAFAYLPELFPLSVSPFFLNIEIDDVFTRFQPTHPMISTGPPFPL